MPRKDPQDARTAIMALLGSNPTLGPALLQLLLESKKRRSVSNSDGSFSSERTHTVGPELPLNPGQYTNIPTMFEGKDVPENEAIRRILRADGFDPESGRKLRGYDDVNTAVRHAEDRSGLLGLLYGGR